MLFLSCSQILSRYIYNTIGINVKSNLDLRNSTGCWRNAVQPELSKGFVILCKLSLTLYHIDINCCLIVSSRREYLALLCRYRCISFDQPRCHAAHRLDRKRERGNIQQQNISGPRIPGQLTALNRCTDRHAFIGIQAFARLMSGQCLNFILYGRNTGRSTYQQYFSQLGSIHPRILQSILYRNSRHFHEIMGQFIEFSPCQIHIKVLRSLCSSSDKR